MSVEASGVSVQNVPMRAVGELAAGRAASPPMVRPVASFELRCGRCGYGAVAADVPSRCPMCGRFAWDFVEWRPFTGANQPS
jgi:rubrerythrin